ncbi:MAG: hypothetical protein D6729_01860 [Deltaproteobacteria bacterium]|nr:MAG: hypothetical protein D6729_01860 [Deltaproteobacteria bacterium]
MNMLRRLRALATASLLLIGAAACGPGTLSLEGAPRGAAALKAGSESLLITEVMRSPVDARRGEWVELYNAGPDPVSLAGWIFDDGDSTDALVLLEGADWVEPGGYALLVDPDHPLTGLEPGVPVYTSTDSALGNGISASDPLLLRRPDGTLVAEAVPPAPSGRGIALERRAIDAPDRPWAWREVPGGTPGRRGALVPSPRVALHFTHPPVDDDTVDAAVAFIDSAEASLDCALYQMNHPRILDAFVRAKRRGVAVRIVTDTTFYDRPDYRQGFVALEAEGILVRPDERSSEMHDKYMVADGERVWIGSWNPTDHVSGDSALEIEDAGLAAVLSEDVDQMMAGRFGVSKVRPEETEHVVDGMEIGLHISPAGGIESRIVSEIDAAEHSVHFLAFSLTQDSIGDALLRAAARGVDVRGAIDWLHATRRGSEWQRLVEAGLDVRRSPHAMLMHHKLIVIDAGTPNARVITGSYNFTGRAETRNDETMLFLRDARLAAASTAAFNAVYTESLRADEAPMPGLRITEVGPEGRWVELMNAGEAPVDLSGYRLSDQERTVRIESPSGMKTFLAPGERALVAMGAPPPTAKAGVATLEADPLPGLRGVPLLLLLDPRGVPVDGLAASATLAPEEALARISVTAFGAAAPTPGE